MSRVEEILKGIDETETESENGWWETSTGAEFGEKKLDELVRYETELRYTQIGFLTGLVIALEAGVNPKEVIEKRIQELDEK